MYLIIKPRIGNAELIHVRTSPGELAESIIKATLGREISWIQILDSKGNAMRGTHAFTAPTKFTESSDIPASNSAETFTDTENICRSMLFSGSSKIVTIKKYRELTGLTIVESKRAIDNLCAGIPGFCRICGSHAEYRSIAQQQTGNHDYDSCRDHVSSMSLSSCIACGQEITLRAGDWINLFNNPVCDDSEYPYGSHKVRPVR